MRKFKIIFTIVSFVYALIGASFFASTSFAEDAPTVPTILGSWYETVPLDFNPGLWIALYNPAIDAELDPEVGERVCSVETRLTFPKDLLNVISVSFTEDETDNFYSNSTGVINFKTTISPCTTSVGIDLFQVSFKPQAVGTGAFHLVSATVLGGGDGTTPIETALYGDMEFKVVPTYEAPTDANLLGSSSSVPSPTVINGSPPASLNSGPGINTSLVKIAPKPENSAYKIPTLAKLEFGPHAILDKTNSKSQGAVFTGTGEPNSKIFLLIQSENEVFTDTLSDATGAWSKTVDEWLEDGSHTVTIWAEKNNTISKKLSSSFVISSYAKDQIAIGSSFPDLRAEKAKAESTTTKRASKLDSLMSNKFFWAYVGIGIVIIVLAIFLIIKARGKKKKTNFPPLSDAANVSAPPNMTQSLPSTFQSPTVQPPQPQTSVPPNPTPLTPALQNSAPIDLTNQNPPSTNTPN